MILGSLRDHWGIFDGFFENLRGFWDICEYFGIFWNFWRILGEFERILGYFWMFLGYFWDIFGIFLGFWYRIELDFVFFEWNPFIRFEWIEFFCPLNWESGGEKKELGNEWPLTRVKDVKVKANFDLDAGALTIVKTQRRPTIDDRRGKILRKLEESNFS